MVVERTKNLPAAPHTCWNRDPLPPSGPSPGLHQAFVQVCPAPASGVDSEGLRVLLRGSLPSTMGSRPILCVPLVLQGPCWGAHQGQDRDVGLHPQRPNICLNSIFHFLSFPIMGPLASSQSPHPSPHHLPCIIQDPNQVASLP